MGSRGRDGAQRGLANAETAGLANCETAVGPANCETDVGLAKSETAVSRRSRYAFSHSKRNKTRFAANTQEKMKIK